MVTRKRYINTLVLATWLPLALCLSTLAFLLLPGVLCPGEALGARATVGGTVGGTGRTSHPAAGQSSPLEILKRRYYLAAEGERFPVLDEIRGLGTDEALQFTLDLLRYPDVKVRREAVDALKRWAGKGYAAVFEGMADPEISWLCESIFVELGQRSSSYLLDLLEDPDPDVRSRAAYLLGSLQDPIAVGPLFKRLKDPDREVRIQVIQSLAQIGDDSSLEGIFGLFETEDVGLTDFVLQAAEKFGPRAAAPLQAALKTGSARVRSGAALALGRLRIPDTLPGLVAALKDRDAGVRRSVVKALDGFHHMSAAEGLFQALKDGDLEVQDYATTALARLHPDIYPALMGRLGDGDPRIRKNVITALRKIGDPGAVPSIVSALDDPDADVRMFALAALIEFRDPRSISGLMARMRSQDEMSWLVSYAFMEIGQEAVDELLKATGDDSFCMTRNLVILQMGDRAIDTLHRKAAGAGEPAVRYNAIALLGELGKAESVPVLTELLRDEKMGWVAAKALGTMGQPAWKELYRLGGEEGVEGLNARHAISELNDPTLYGDLVDALECDSASLRQAAAEPLVRAGAPVVNLVVEKMAGLTGEKFNDGAEVLCRIKDQRALRPLSKVLFPEPWEPSLLGPGQLYELRQIYARKGGLEPVMARLKEEVGRAGGGGGPWERVAP